MYKLILVDDEEDVREGLLELMDWEGLGYHIVDTAENGREAAEMVDKYIPDVVVTDIQMPFMDGLQLCEWIREYYPATKIIILTGYEEFDYAKKAIKLGINEYILKPFSSTDLAETLGKVRTALDEEMATKENIQLLTEHYRKNLPVLQSLFLSSLVSRRLTNEEIQEKIISYELDVQGDAYTVSVISIDPILLDDRGDSSSSPKPASLRNTNDLQLQLFAVLNIVQEIADDHMRAQVFINHEEVVVIGIHDNANNVIAGDICNKMLPLLNEMKYSVERYLKFTVSIGLGSLATEMTCISSSYEEAQRAIDYRMILGTNKVIWIRDVEARQFQTVTFDEMKERELIRCLKLGEDRELHQLLDELFASLVDHRVDDHDFHLYLIMMLTAVIKAAQDVQVDLNQLFDEGFMLFTQLAKMTNASEAKLWFVNVCMKLKKSIAEQRQSSYNLLVEDAKEYISQHYDDQDLSIAKVCSQLHISAGYFSNIFKKETKLTFVNYLLNVRMEEAQNLLRMTDLKAFEIADQVGFSDPNYFSFCFRKKFGVSPKEYRAGAKTT